MGAFEVGLWVGFAVGVVAGLVLVGWYGWKAGLIGVRPSAE